MGGTFQEKLHQALEEVDRVKQKIGREKPYTITSEASCY